ncbi:hypothetical protein SCUCBS95973_000579 [Sporothrix curviconia]|uniref:MOSC domain-containing protein n=1 Tax=Sporothrix curviconia TaxID=1260050 RepID=A0ABP0ARH9_9PEZI
MKVTGLYVYPVKALRGIAMPTAELGPQGIRYDRRFMLLTKKRSKKQTLAKMQLSSFPECALFSQEIVDAKAAGESPASDGDKVVVVHYHPPEKGENGERGVAGGDSSASKVSDSNRIVMSPVQHPPLRIPLNPSYGSLQPLDVNLHGSPARGYRMGDPYDAWFSACFGFDVVLVYIGDGQRKVLGDALKLGVHLPKKKTTKTNAEKNAHAASPPNNSLFALVLTYVVGACLALLAALGLRRKTQEKPDEPWIAFSDCAPFLVTAESSLRNVSARMSEGVEVPMYKFRPNIVVDGEGEEEWAEDYWGELTVTRGNASQEASAPSTPSLSRSRSTSSLASLALTSASSATAVTPDKETPTGPVRLLLTSNCARCTSLNVDYSTGTRAAGELGEVLKRLAKDRRVDPGTKYSPVFGRYAFLDQRGGAKSLDDDDEEDGVVQISVGNEVAVTRRNAERTVWDWPDL